MCCCCCECVIAAAAVDDDVDGSGNRVGTVHILLQGLHTFKRVNIHAQFCALMQCSNNDARGNLLKGGRTREAWPASWLCLWLFVFNDSTPLFVIALAVAVVVVVLVALAWHASK